MKKSLAIFVLVCMTAINCYANDKVIVAAADPWPPFVDPSNPKEGLSLEVIRAAYKTQGYVVEMEYVPWSRAEKGVKEGKYDILPNTWITEERQAYLDYSEPYAVNEVKFIKKKGDPFEFEGLKSLSGKTIGTVRGYGYGSEFLADKTFKRDESNNLITNIKKLIHASKRIDLTLEDEIVARVAIANENPELLKEIEFTKKGLSKKELYVTTGKVNPRHTEIINAFNKGLAEIKANGEYQKIMEGYGIK